MKKVVTSKNDFPRQQVPQNKTYSGFHIALIMVGGTISIPNFLTSAQIGSSLGLAAAIPAFLLGCLVLGILVGFTSYVGARTHYSTYMITEFAFGRTGAKLANLIIALSLIGWFGIICNIFAQVSDQIVQHIANVVIPLWVYVAIGSSLVVAVTVSGFKGLDKLALALVPLMAAFLFYAAWLAYDHQTIWQQVSDEKVFTFSSAVSAIIGSYIAGVVIQPDYSRYARNTKHAIIAAFFALGISFPLIMVLLAIPSIATSQSDIIQVMLVLGIGIPAFLLLLLAAWSSNVLCLYSSGLSLATIFTRVNLWKIIIAIGIIGTAIAFVRAQEFLVSFLILLGVTVPPIAAIYIANVLFVRKGECNEEDLYKEPAIKADAFIAWLLAIGMGYLAHIGQATISGVAGIDSILLAFIVYLLINCRKIINN